MNNIPELLSPAGDYECLCSALDFGADAVYIGGKSFGMRAGAKNFDDTALPLAVSRCHENGKKLYLTLNTVPTNEEIELMPEFIRYAEKCGVDAVIVADIGVMALVKKHAPNMEIHMSTQVGIVNYETANELYKMGAKRIVLAREVDLENIKRIRDKIPADMDIEAFVHGAMCVSFSGRCLLSMYLTGRDANRGECAQPCRWGYYLMEENRPNQFMKITEDERGTYILNAKDMCMLPHLEKLRDAGISSFKIEGRAKSAYYVATVTNAYRAGLDAISSGKPVPEWAVDEVMNVSHRPYCTGFYFGKPTDCQYYESSGYTRSYDFVGIVDEWRDGVLYITQRNYFKISDELEILCPEKKPIKLKIDELFNMNGEKIDTANHATEKLYLPYPEYVPPRSVIRRPNTD